MSPGPSPVEVGPGALEALVGIAGFDDGALPALCRVLVDAWVWVLADAGAAAPGPHQGDAALTALTVVVLTPGGVEMVPAYSSEARLEEGMAALPQLQGGAAVLVRGRDLVAAIGPHAGLALDAGCGRRCDLEPAQVAALAAGSVPVPPLARELAVALVELRFEPHPPAAGTLAQVASRLLSIVPEVARAHLAALPELSGGATHLLLALVPAGGGARAAIELAPRLHRVLARAAPAGSVIHVVLLAAGSAAECRLASAVPPLAGGTTPV